MNLRERKYFKSFHFFDVDRNSYVDADDYRRAMENIARLRSLKPEDTMYQRLRQALDAHWDYVRAFADENGDGRVSFAEWQSSWTRFEAEHTGKTFDDFPQWLIDMVDAMIDFVDVDGDGLISEADYDTFFRAFNVQEDSSEAFRNMTDRPLDRETVKRLVFEFNMSTVDTAPGNWLFGKI